MIKTPCREKVASFKLILPAEDETELVMVSYYLFRGVASIFSGVRTIHQMRLNPFRPPHSNVPKGEVIGKPKRFYGM